MIYPFYDLKQVECDETENDYFFTEQMLQENIFITYSTVYNHRNDRIDSLVEVTYFNNEIESLDAEKYVLYWDNLLSPIQIYRIVQDIYDMYSERTTIEFLKVMRELSTQYTSAQMQSIERHKKSMLEETSAELNRVKELAEELSC